MSVFIPFLAVWEMVLHHGAVWVSFPFVLTQQYMIKNMVLLSAALVIGATVRGGRLTRSETRGRRRSKRSRLDFTCNPLAIPCVRRLMTTPRYP
ncbi:MAG: hypothetical protein IT326_05470 [Anaerolineae bacterium]|nr:hypothetical protein [Anaerolineae bacterium]